MKFTEEQAHAIFAAAGFHVWRVWELPNGYWPDCATYDDLRRESPWFLMRTRWGCIRIGWRKRVLSIDWEDVGIKINAITSDDVTQGAHYVHAWTVPKAVEYLVKLLVELERAMP